jgi:hypothetical protein
MSGDVRTKILNEIESSGFPLEIATFRDLHEAGWVVSPNLHYRGSAADVHEIDAFAAITSFPNPVVLGTVGRGCAMTRKGNTDPLGRQTDIH